MTTQEITESLCKDFLTRDKDTFVFKRKDNRYEWEKDIEKGKDYSTYVFTPKELVSDFKGLIRRAQAMLCAMGIPKPQVCLTADGSFTDSKKVWISTKFFDEKELSLGQKNDIFLGFAVHEGCHLLYTDFKCAEEFDYRSSTLKHLENIIEDERIERLLGEDKPGLVNFIASTKDYCWGNRSKNNSLTLQQDDIQNCVNAVLAIIRYPRLLTDEFIEKYGELLLQIRDLLLDFPTSTRQSWETAYKIRELIFKHYERKKEEEKENENSQDNDSDSGDEKDNSECQDKEQGDGASDSDNEKTDNDSSSSDENGNQDEASKESNKQKSKSGSHGEEGEASDEESDNNEGEDQGENKGEGNDKSNEKPEDEEEKPNEQKTSSLTEEEKEKLRDEINRQLESTFQKMAKDDNALKEFSANSQSNPNCMDSEIEKTQSLNIFDLMEVEGKVEIGHDKTTVFFNKESTPHGRELYDNYLQRVKPYLPAIRKAICANREEYTRTLYGLRNGHLDTNHLVDGTLGATTIYTRKEKVINNKLAVCLVIDLSGSMGGTRIENAMMTAILLEKALETSDVELFIYGHHADRPERKMTTIEVFRDLKTASKKRLGECRASGNNRDGVALEEIALKVREQTSGHVLMFVISDGQPNAFEYKGLQAVNHTKSAVQKIEKMNFSVMQIAISNECNSKSMFKRYISINNVSELAGKMKSLVQKAVLQSTKQQRL